MLQAVLPRVVLNAQSKWWLDVVGNCSGCREDDWLPCCDAGEAPACSDQVPLPLLSMAALRSSRDFTEYHTMPFRHVNLSAWRKAGYLVRRVGRHGPNFEMSLPQHPFYGWFLPTTLEKLFEARRAYARNPGSVVNAAGPHNAAVDAAT
eukprot:TRINITY_DN41652_c0_g1_i1.p1 TRINITY_DN41652_c0_g1~~TRINITY_DN41652_c0_g1_i1.p1  ORF type:complete len:149 (+),score=22.96 TRINITY_DN41652_c0_g1_i1:225-671(+)